MVLNTFTLLCTLHHYPSSELFLLLQMQLCTHLNINSPFYPFPVPDNHHSTFCLYEFNYSKCLIYVESYILLYDWLVSLSIISSGFIHVVANIRTSFLFKAELYSIVCIDHILFIHSSMYGYLGCFYLLIVVNDAAMNIRVTSICSSSKNCFQFFRVYTQKWNCWIIW